MPDGVQRTQERSDKFGHEFRQRLGEVDVGQARLPSRGGELVLRLLHRAVQLLLGAVVVVQQLNHRDEATRRISALPLAVEQRQQENHAVGASSCANVRGERDDVPH